SYRYPHPEMGFEYQMTNPTAQGLLAYIQRFAGTALAIESVPIDSHHTDDDDAPQKTEGTT
ncbi:MAG: hypothetical protein OTJ43_09860, partial [Dehalococcoidia bacterium]|nr:hypothetical protein [Dehalococcoidia bacterium]